MTAVVFGGLFGLAALLWILWPLVKRGSAPAASRTVGIRDDLSERTLVLYQELEEIDLEHEQGDLTAEEYAALRETQKQQVLALLAERQRAAEALPAGEDVQDTATLSAAIEEEILRIRAQRRGEQYVPAEQRADGVAPAPALARGVHWLWIGVPLALVLIAFGVIFQLYRTSARTLTEQTPIARVDAAGLIGFAHIAPGHVLLAHENGLLESRDGGRAWTASALAAEPAALATSPAGEGTAYVFTAQSFHVTADAGETWQEVVDTLPGNDILAAAVDPFTPTDVYASFAELGLFRSRDGGRSWEPIATPAEEQIVAVLVSHAPPLIFIALESGRVQVSTDEGETWSAASGAVTMALRGPVRALTGAVDGSMLYAAAHTGLFMSTSAGQTWIDLPLRKPLLAVAVDPSSERTVVAVTESGEVYRSLDGGISWRNE